MKPAAGTRLFFIGDEGVLFSTPRQELHAFNTTACVIWCHLEEGRSPSEIARALTGDGGIEEATARAHVDKALADWTAKGLLAGGPEVPLAMPPEEPVPDLPPPSGDGFVDFRDYRALGTHARVRFGIEELRDLIDPLFAHLACGRDAPPDFAVDVAAAGDGIGIWLNGAAAAFCGRHQEVAPAVKGVVWTEVLHRQDFLMHVHAGVVGGPAGCVLLPAAPGSGKSTLTTALVHAGFDLFSDEVALLAPDLTVSPFPTAICVKDTGIEAIARLYPSVRGLPLHERPDGKRVVYLPPPAGSVPPEGHRRRVRGIVFPRYVAGAAMASRRLAPTEALARLLAHCMNVGRLLDEASVGDLIRWIGPMPCAEIEYGSLEPPLAWIDALLRGE